MTDRLYVKPGVGPDNLLPIAEAVAPAGFISPIWPTGSFECVHFSIGEDDTPYEASLTSAITYIRMDRATQQTVTVPDGTQAGQCKRFVSLDYAQSGFSVVAPLTYEDFDAYIFETEGQGCTLQWTGTAWRCIGLTGVTNGALVLTSPPASTQ